MTRQATMNPRILTPRSGRGFTLIELATIIGILGVLSLVAIASMGTTLSVRRNVAARTLASTLNRQREMAVTTGVGTWTAINVSGSSYSLFTENPATPGRGNAVAQVNPDTGAARVVVINSGSTAGVTLASVSIAGGGTDIGFDWLGRPRNSAGTLLSSDAVITFASGTTVTLTKGTGLARTP